MNLWCMDDRQGWGRGLAAEAKARGHDARLFTRASEVGDGYVFARVDQRQPRLDADRAEVEALAGRNVLVPDWRMTAEYEDKGAQAEHYRRWMPRTALLQQRGMAEDALDREFAPPFVSKSRHGSASKNVRMIASRDDARREIDLAFDKGIPVSGGVQRGYLIWQEFCAGNPYDYRVIVNGRRHLMLRRYNRDDVPFASGSGRLEAITEATGEAAVVLDAAKRFFEANGMLWCGIDMVKNGQWKVLETTVAWTIAGYAGCRWLGDPKGRDGTLQWAVFMDELEAGVFG